MAHAQSRPSAAIIGSRPSDQDDAGLAASLERALRVSLGALDAIDLTVPTSLQLSDIQLTLGCQGLSTTCLDRVAAELSVQQLVLPRLDRVGTRRVLTVSLYDASDHSLREVARQSADGGESLLEQLDDVARELVGLPASVTREAPTVRGVSTERNVPSGRDAPADPVIPPAVVEPELAGPIALIAVSGATLIVGGAVGISSLSLTEGYADIAVNSEADADRALAQFRDATDQAIAADVLLAAGAALAAGGLTWLVVALLETPPDELALAPIFGPAFAGATLGGEFQ